MSKTVAQMAQMAYMQVKQLCHYRHRALYAICATQKHTGIRWHRAGTNTERSYTMTTPTPNSLPRLLSQEDAELHAARNNVRGRLVNTGKATTRWTLAETILMHELLDHFRDQTRAERDARQDTEQ